MNTNDTNQNRFELFFPYYINQSRLLDIYAILNGGYSEYSEITSSASIEKTKSAKAQANVSGGFKLLNIGANAAGNIASTGGNVSENKEKKVQTVTSILCSVKDTLQEKGYLSKIDSAKVGNFVNLPVVLQINSIKSLMGEISELFNLCTSMKQIGAQVKDLEKHRKELDGINKSIQVLFAGEEIFFETNSFAIIGNILDDNLYQASRSDLIGTELKCLAQVKRIFPNGCQLMRNTIFTKIQDASAKDKFIEFIREIDNDNEFDFQATAIPQIEGKPVYQLEIIALYQ